MAMELGNARRQANIEISRLRPTQLTVGMLEVKVKRKRLRELERRPGELVDFILLTPIRVVLGPMNRAYVIDHHHLGLALLKEKFETAPMEIEADFSHLRGRWFWKKMQAEHFLHLFNAKGKPRPLRSLPRSLRRLKDDPYRSVAGFVRIAGGYAKTQTPYAEFQWADFFRQRVDKKLLRDNFSRAVKKGVRLARSRAAAELPGFLGRRDRAFPRGKDTGSRLPDRRSVSRPL
jgi:hypothetical protein